MKLGKTSHAPSIFQILKEDKVEELEHFLCCTNNANYVVTERNEKNEFCCNSPPLISVACFFGSINCFRYLQNREANMTKADSAGRVPAHFAAAGGNLEVCDALDDMGINFRVKSPENHDACLYACKFKHIDLVKRFWARGFDFDTPGNDSLLPIHIACQNKDLELLEFLLEEGCDVNQPTSTGETPIHIVLANGANDLLRMLVRHGVNTDFYQSNFMMTPLMYAIRNNHTEVVEILVSSDKENINKIDPLGWTALHYAAENGSTNICRMLINRGASVNAQTNHKMTPLHLAQNRKRTDTVEFLISVGGLTWV